MTVGKYFERYIAIDTQSDEESTSFPSTDRQFVLAMVLLGDLHELGIQAYLSDWGYVYGEIPATPGREQDPAIGLLAHMDTSSAASDANVQARLVPYAGGDIVLNAEKNILLSAVENPALSACVGQDLYVTDGTTLLGADDKAGIAEIMALTERLVQDASIPHGKVMVAFTPDEETGRGTLHFDIENFGADFAYTVDGGALGELEYESFNAAGAKVIFHGLSLHTGDAKDRMKNACLFANEFVAMLPPAEAPEHTEGYEGFYHVSNLSGEVERAEVNLLIRDHNRTKFEARKNFVARAAAYLNEKYGAGSVECTITDTYANMREIIETRMDVVERARAAFVHCGVEPVSHPIRGGTDGSHLSFMGLICPNLSTGGFNFHGRFEFIPLQAMEKMVDVLEELVKI